MYFEPLEKDITKWQYKDADTAVLKLMARGANPLASEPMAIDVKTLAAEHILRQAVKLARAEREEDALRLTEAALGYDKDSYAGYLLKFALTNDAAQKEEAIKAVRRIQLAMQDADAAAGLIAYISRIPEDAEAARVSEQEFTDTLISKAAQLLGVPVEKVKSMPTQFDIVRAGIIHKDAMAVSGKPAIVFEGSTITRQLAEGLKLFLDSQGKIKDNISVVVYGESAGEAIDILRTNGIEAKQGLQETKPKVIVYQHQKPIDDPNVKYIRLEEIADFATQGYSIANILLAIFTSSFKQFMLNKGIQRALGIDISASELDILFGSVSANTISIKPVDKNLADEEMRRFRLIYLSA